MRRIALIVFAAVFVPLMVVWLGFRISAPIPEPELRSSSFSATTVLYDGLPAGLQYYLAQTVSRTPPITQTAVLWGTARIRMEFGPIGLWLPLAWRQAIDARRGFVWRAQVTWWRWPILHVEDRWSDGVGVMRIGGRRISTPWIAQGAAMRMMGELVWLPSALITTKGITWHARGDWQAVMRYKGPLGPDSLIFRFDPRTRALVSIEGMRCKEDSVRVPWQVRLTGWDAPGGLTIPVEGEIVWEDRPSYTFRVAGIVYNVPVDEWFEETTP